MDETHVYEKKSYRKAFGASPDLNDLAKTCVCLANAQGGSLLLGIEDKEEEPPRGQQLSQREVNELVKKLSSRAVNVSLGAPELLTAPNGGQYLRLPVQPSLHVVATTSDGRTYARLSDQCQPVTGEDLHRLVYEKTGLQWEIRVIPDVRLADLSARETRFFVERVRTAAKASPFVLAKSDAELLEYYHLVTPAGQVTHLGVLWLGTPAQRARLSYGLMVQYVVYDEQEQKVRKETWLDHRLNPAQLLDELLAQAVELRYYHEIPAGATRRQVRHYPEAVLRELLANAFAHRLYTTATDVFVGVYPNRLEITSPGGLPLGVTPTTILHERMRRNPHLTATFQATGLMEGEGSGYDLIYEQLSREAKPLPVLDDSGTSLRVTVKSQLPDADTLRLLDYLAGHYAFQQKEIIVLGLIAQRRRLSATELTQALQLRQEERTRTWLGRLVEWGIVQTQGVKKGTDYVLNPEVFAAANLQVKPTLKTIEPHRLRALLEEDLRAYPNSSLAEIHQRLGEELAPHLLRRQLLLMTRDNLVEPSGGNRNRRYSLVAKKK
ncbi:putative DNA binding domain-containing protein [Hymenobacter sp. J193]|uniref:ATP-binding protein n=1 Tax=Hymenobacter sp. J193 TaxID=2898429 RepID=UPI002151BE98|nr:ATP-binding protein [Hymenobacter sp. J193]MCR5888014.1 putative DNA binding domain-containing protein [Hymenobacter sp. J193]